MLPRAWCIASTVFALSACGRVLELRDDYYLAAGGYLSTAGSTGGGLASAGDSSTAGGGTSGENGTGGAGGTGGAPNIAGAAGETSLFTMPDGKLVFERYSRYEVGDSKMYVVTFPGGTIGPELSATYDICSPFNGIFSPDGRYLVVGAVPASVCPNGYLDRNELELYILDLENPTPQGKQRVTDNNVPDEDPQYAPDGKSILFKHGGYLARWVVGSTPFIETCADAGGSYCFKHSGGLFQSKPVVDDTGYVCYESSLNQGDPNGDILCFDLAVGLAGKDITLQDNVTRAVGHTNIYDSRPVIALPYLYYTRWRVPAAPHTNQIWRKQLKNLSKPEELAAFCVDEGVGYEDVFSLGVGDLVVFSTNANAVGMGDLYIGDFKQKESMSLSDIAPGVNSPLEELGAAFWHAPAPLP